MSETNEHGSKVEKLMASIKEYSNEDINDPEAAKEEIEKLLKTHRTVKLADYEYGVTNTGKKDHVLYVKKENDKSKVHQYLKRKNSWYCSNHFYPAHKCYSLTLKIKYGIVFAPTNHSDKCRTKEYSYVMEIQDLLKQGKKSEAHSLSMRRRTSLNHTLNQFLSPSNFNESNLSTNDMDITTDSMDIAPSESLTSTSVETVPESSRSKRVLDDTEYRMIIVQPPAKKPKIESIDAETFSFTLPSSAVLKNVCQKLGIKYTNDAYKFWGEIIFDEISSFSDNIKLHSFKSQNIFACLSQFFTGNYNKCFVLQQVINTAFHDDLIVADAQSSDIEELFIKATVSDQQLEFICKFLLCRIGIYENGSLKKFGKWETENNDVLTLILSIENGFYSVVLDL